jgi:DNA polymerase I-like protein with 3'-5' exonuclease and polymerase domains
LIHNLAEEAGIDILQHIHCHDEVVLSCHEPNAETMAKLCELAAIEAGKFFNINLPIEAEAKIGLNWYDVH